MRHLFGNIGVCVKNYTRDSLYALLVEHHLGDLMGDRYMDADKPFTQDVYLQSDSHGRFTEDTLLNVHKGFVNYVIDMENFLHILRVGILDADAANNLVEELFSQGLLKLRDSDETH